MAFEKSQSAGFLANHMARLFATALARRIQPLGLAPAQFMVLLELWADDGQTQSELVSRLAVEQATMANTLARMERDGLIERKASPDDGRARIVTLTERARELQQPAVIEASRINEAALSGLSAGERAVLLQAMRSVIGSLQKHG